MGKRFLLILTLFFVLSVSYCIAYADMYFPPSDEYKNNVLKTVKPKKGSLKEYKTEYKKVKAFVINDNYGRHSNPEYKNKILLDFQIENEDSKYVLLGDRVNIILSASPKLELKGEIDRNSKSIGRVPENRKIFDCSVVLLNPLSEEEKGFFKTGNIVDVILKFSSENVYLVPNEFVYDYGGKKFMIMAFGFSTYANYEVTTGISNDKYTEIFIPSDPRDAASHDVVVFKDNSKRDFILENGSNRNR